MSWDEQPLGDLLEDGRSISYGIVQPGEHRAGGVPIVRVNAVRDGVISPSDPLRVAPEIEATYARTRLVGGELLLTLVGTVGEAAEVPPELVGWNVARAVGVIPVRREVGSRWVRYALQTPRVRHLIDSWCNTTVQKTLNLKDVARIPISVPPPKVREAITAVLGALDDKIALNRRINGTLETMAQALFKSWFIDFDPVRAKVAHRQPTHMGEGIAKLFPERLCGSERGQIPEGWNISQLKSLTSKIGSGATPRGGDRVYVETGVALIRSQNVYDSEFIWDGLARITDVAAEQLRGVTVAAGDVLLNITGASILRTTVVSPAVLPARVNQHVAIIRARPGISARFLHLHLLRPSTKNYLLGMDAGASRQAVTKGHIESVSIVQPPENILSAFDNVVGPMFQNVEANTAQNLTLRQLQELLLPKLLSGEIRLQQADAVVAKAI